MPASDARSLLDLEEHHPPDTVLFREGEPAGDLIILVSGRLGVYRGDRRVAEIDEPGAYVGETSALTQQPRTATVRTESPTTVLRVPRSRVPAFLRAAPEVAVKLASNLAERLRETTDRLVESIQQREEVERQFDAVLDELTALYGHLRTAADGDEARIEALNTLRRLINRHATRIHRRRG